MILDVDIGNTRLKWLLKDSRGQPVSRGQSLNGQWLASLQVLGPGVSRVRIASVQGELCAALLEFCGRTWGVEGELARVADGTAGLICGYRNPAQLGIDRWLALLACWSNIGRRAIVVDAGSALTIDLLAPEGHGGGYILPGVAMMKHALGRGTWGIRADKAETADLHPADNTGDAVTNGAVIALVGAVEQAAARGAALGCAQEIETLVLTGGDAPLLGQFLKPKFNVIEVPDLVLDGLEVALP